MPSTLVMRNAKPRQSRQAARQADRADVACQGYEQVLSQGIEGINTGELPGFFSKIATSNEQIMQERRRPIDRRATHQQRTAFVTSPEGSQRSAPMRSRY